MELWDSCTGRKESCTGVVGVEGYIWDMDSPLATMPAGSSACCAHTLAWMLLLGSSGE